MSVTFRVEVLNTENNNTEALPFNLANGKISGKCAIDRKHDAIISSTIEEENGRVKKLKFAFRTVSEQIEDM
ncbi:unnamed protein product [Caenorhabditis angaria]|uniref:Uncharacterized protein n=1 Tax=Caenorhabditis angaria TaxID=860376 RepID=A0A9P1N880_9PELO|nr:unnamed protein product [Caenorhabditis angaria]